MALGYSSPQTLIHDLIGTCCCCLVAQVCLTLCDPMDYRLLCPWDSPGKNTEEGCHSLLQGISPTQRLNPGLLHWPADSLPSSHQKSPIGTQCRARSIILLCDFRSCLPNTNIHRWKGKWNHPVFCLKIGKDRDSCNNRKGQSCQVSDVFMFSWDPDEMVQDVHWVSHDI